MANQIAQKSSINQQNDNIARLDALFSQLPNHVYDWLFSEQTGQDINGLSKKFGLTERQAKEIMRITGLAALKDFPLSQMIPEIKISLNIDDQLAKQIAVAIAQTQFLSLRDHLVDVENFIRQMGGSLPTALPPLQKSVGAATGSPAPAPTPPINIVQKTLRQLVKDNKDALNQNLTAVPIKIADFDQPVRPTIKNWLVDYVKQKGAGHHEALERGDYLFNSVNSRPLPENEKALLAEILRAYDDDSPLPVDEAIQTILLDKLTVSLPNLPKATPAATAATQPPIPPIAAPRGDLPKSEPPYGGYREPVSEADLSGPFKRQPPAKPAPRLSGNIIDLKDLQ